MTRLRLSSVSLFVVLVLAKSPGIDLAIEPILVPPYPELSFRSRLEGRIEVLIRFENTVPVAVEIAESELKFVQSGPERLPESDNIVVRSLENTLLSTLRQWRSEFVRDYETVVKIHYRTDPSLGRDDRAYLVRYGRLGVAEEITVTGPRIESR